MQTLRNSPVLNTYGADVSRGAGQDRSIADGFVRQPINFIVSRACRDLDRGRLTPRERRFVYEMVALGKQTPSAAQSAWLRAIMAKLCGKAAA